MLHNIFLALCVFLSSCVAQSDNRNSQLARNEETYGIFAYVNTRCGNVAVSVNHLLENFQTVLGEEVKQPIGSDETDILLFNRDSEQKYYTQIGSVPKIGDSVTVSTWDFYGEKSILMQLRGVVVGYAEKYVIVQVPGWFGMSGSPVYNEQNELVGSVSRIKAVGAFFGPSPIGVIFITRADLVSAEVERFCAL